MAWWLSKALGSTPETWAGMQIAHDLAHFRSRGNRIEVERIVGAAE